MAGHVSMMNDVLIANMPVEMVRSTLRHLVSRDAMARTLLVEHARQQLLLCPRPRPSAAQLFPPDGSVDALKDYLSTVRCYTSCHLLTNSLSLLSALVDAIKAESALWLPDSERETQLIMLGADTVQAVQAVKESAERPESLEADLFELLRRLDDCNRYCISNRLSQPLARAQVQVADAVCLLFPSANINGYAPHPIQPLAVDISAQQIRKKSPVERMLLGGKLEIPRMFNGLWQMSSPAWGTASGSKMDEALMDLVRNGLVAADMADHYGDAELVYGSFRNRLPEDIRRQVITATKWCVFAPLQGPATPELVLNAVQERADRTGGTVDLLQFHWQDYKNRDFLPIVKMLVDLTRSRPDLVTAIGLCNFDALQATAVCEYMLAETGQVGIVSNQVQYSLIDSRPLFGLGEVCQKYGIQLLTYGSFCGGFLSDRWLDKPAPSGYGQALPLTPSQRKYLDMINTWGSWDDFSDLLRLLKTVGARYQATIANVATRWVLQRPEVGAVIVGTRLGVSSNVKTNLGAFEFELSAEDISAIDAMALGSGRAKARHLFEVIGDCGQEYR